MRPKISTDVTGAGAAAFPVFRSPSASLRLSPALPGLEGAQASPGDLATNADFDSVALGWGPRAWDSEELPGRAAAAVLRWQMSRGEMLAPWASGGEGWQVISRLGWGREGVESRAHLLLQEEQLQPADPWARSECGLEAGPAPHPQLGVRAASLPGPGEKGTMELSGKPQSSLFKGHSQDRHLPLLRRSPGSLPALGCSCQAGRGITPESLPAC